MILSGLEITIEDAHQIINMGGPWIGKLYIDSVLIAEDCIVDNFVFNEQWKSLFFVKYHHAVKSTKKNYFTINFYQTDNRTVYQFEKVWAIVYLDMFLTANKLQVHHAFHNKIITNRGIFDLDEEDFRAL
jgi:hypothetical protein